MGGLHGDVPCYAALLKLIFIQVFMMCGNRMRFTLEQTVAIIKLNYKLFYSHILIQDQ